nr:excalibur calcium-binding domain-containing protein [Nakamurella lactea]
MKRILVIGAALATLLASVVAAPSAAADTVIGQGNATGSKYHAGVPARGGISFAVGLQVSRNSAGVLTAVRGVGRITKISKALKVQVDRVDLGTATAAVIRKNTPVNSGTGATALSYTGWKNLAAGTCVSYRTRAYFSVRWTDNQVSKFSVLSPLSKVCRAAAAPAPTPRKYANCAALNQVYPHGVGRPGARDKTSGTPVTNFTVSTAAYNLNIGSDRDKDGIACEKH